MNQYVNSKSGVRLLMALVMGIFLFGTVISIAQAQATFPNEDGPLRPRTTRTGRFDFVVQGAGMEGVSTATLVLPVPSQATRIEAAYLYWSGIQPTGSPTDPNVFLQVDGGTVNPVTALTVYGPSFWYNFGGSYSHEAYVADVTSLIQTGTHNYTFSGYTLAPAPDTAAYGFSIYVVYEDPALSVTEIHILDGLDSVYWNFTGVRGSPSSDNCITFAADNTKNRPMDITIIAGGVNNELAQRPNNLYYVTFVSPNTPTITAATVITNPLSSADGPEVDTYENRIVVPSGNTAACFRMVSVAPTPPTSTLNGASFIWQVGAFSLRDETPTAINLQSATAVSPSTYVLLTSLVGLLFLAVPTAVVIRQHRRQE